VSTTESLCQTNALILTENHQLRTELAAAQECIPVEDFCACNKSISLQMISGGAHASGLYGTLTLKIDDKYVEYVPDPPQPTDSEWQEYAGKLREALLTIQTCEDGVYDILARNALALPFPQGESK